jgi:eukaryotic-like serine/threonine-protein kinase
MTENRSYLDTFAAQEKLESFKDEKFVSVKNKSKQARIITAVIILAIVLVGSLLIYYALSRVQVPRIVGMTLEEANVWATKNRIILVTKSVYDFESDSGIIVSQEVSAGNSVQKNATLTVEVSLGADPQEKIAWLDVKSMTTSQIEAWISDNKLTGVKVVTANSDVVAANHVISYSLTDDTEENFVRKSRATINVSIGPAAQSETVVVSDFSSMKAAAIVQWGKENGVTINLSEAFDDYVAAGGVISQSVKATTEIKKTDSIAVVISLGKPITMPDFSLLTQTEANSWAKDNGVTLITQEKYSGSDTKGNLLNQSVAAGTTIQAGDEIKLTYSLGRIELASFIGKTKLDILNWQNDVNAKGGNIILTFSEDYGDKGSAGKIIGQSVRNDYVVPGTKVNLVLSLGMKLLTPDFSGKTESECKSTAQSMGFTILFSYQSSSKIARGYVISQSPAKNTVMSDANPMTVVISLTGDAANTVAIPDFKTMSKDEANAWAKTNGITLTFIEKYYNDENKGVLYKQNVAAGENVAQGTDIMIYYSLGQVEMASYVGKTKLEMLNWLAAVNAKGGSILAQYTYANDQSYPMNIILGQSIMNTYIPTGTTVTFNLSWDPTVPTPTP